mgnify:CR=1 FL=1
MKKRLVCDFEGKCKNKAFREVYRSLLGGEYKNKGWSYLCRKHLYDEQRRFKKIGKALPWSGIIKKIDYIRNYHKKLSQESQ